MLSPCHPPAPLWYNATMQKLLLTILLLLLLPVWTVAQDVPVQPQRIYLPPELIERLPPEILEMVERGEIEFVDSPELADRMRHDYDDAEDRMMMEFMIPRLITAAFEEDPSGILMALLAVEGEYLLPGFVEEFGITREQIDRVDELMISAEPENMEALETLFDSIVERIMANPDDYAITEEEGAVLDAFFKHALQAGNVAITEAFTDEQIQKLDGMILALTGGLESPFFNERHMAAIEMTDEQRAQFKAIDEALKPERDQMIAALSKEVIRMTESGEISFNGLVAAFSQFRGFSRELRQRRMDVLTAAQVTRVRQLTRLPDFLSVRNLLPQWIPGPGSWQPGDPLPEGAVPRQPQPRNFPRPVRE